MADHDEPTGDAHDDPALWSAAEGTEPGDYTDTDAPPPAAAEDAVFGDPAAQPASNVTRLHREQSLEDAIAALERAVLGWWAEGKTEITMADVLGLTDDPASPNWIDRSRPWLYPAMQALVARDDMQLVQHDGPRRWTRAA